MYRYTRPRLNSAGANFMPPKKVNVYLLILLIWRSFWLKSWFYSVNIMSELSICPWDQLPINLAGVQLEISEKYWIGNEIVAHGKSTSEIAELLNLSPRTIRKYAHSVRYNKCLHKGPSRPRIIDKIGMTIVLEQSSTEVPFNRKRIGDKLLVAYQDTSRRRVTNISDEDLPAIMSKRTRIRYVNLVCDVVNEKEDIEEALTTFD